MSVQYAAGTKVNNTFSGVTKTDILSNVLSSLTAAGWTLVNGITPSTITISIASPAVVTLANHGLAANTIVVLNTTGALPSGLSTNTTYFVISPTTNTFNLSTTSGGSAIATSLTQSGVHTLSSEILMQCATTPQSYNIRCRFRDNTGSSVQFSIETSDGVKVGGNSTTAGGPITPGLGKVWRIVANKHQFTMWQNGDYTSGCNFILVSCPYVFSFMSPTYIGFMVAGGRNDTDTTTTRNGNWRYKLRMDYADGNYGCAQVLFNTTFIDYQANNSTSGGNGRGWPGIIPSVWCPNNPSYLPAGVNNIYRWANGDALTQDALLSWGLTAPSDESQIAAQLWDALIIQDNFFGDTTTSFDAHNWICLTNSITSYYSALFLVTP